MADPSLTERVVDLPRGAIENEPVADPHVRGRQHPDVEDIAQPEELFEVARANHHAGDWLGGLDVPTLKGDGWLPCQGQSWRGRSVFSNGWGDGSCRENQAPYDEPNPEPYPLLSVVFP